MQDLKNRIKFYQQAERDARKITKIQKEIDEMERALLSQDPKQMSEALKKKLTVDLGGVKEPQALTQAKQELKTQIHNVLDAVFTAFFAWCHWFLSVTAAIFEVR